jgi:hypothetical protein
MGTETVILLGNSIAPQKLMPIAQQDVPLSSQTDSADCLIQNGNPTGEMG